MRIRIIVVDSTPKSSAECLSRIAQEREEKPVLYVSREQSIKNKLRSSLLEIQTKDCKPISTGVYASTRVYSKRSQSFQADQRFPEKLGSSTADGENSTTVWDVIVNSVLWHDLQRHGVKDLAVPIELEAKLITKVDVAGTIILTSPNAIPNQLKLDPCRLARLLAGKHVSVGNELHYPSSSPPLALQVVDVRSSAGITLPVAVIADSTCVEFIPYFSAVTGSGPSTEAELISPQDWLAAVKEEIGGYATTVEEIIEYMYTYLEEALGRKKGLVSSSATPFKGIFITGRPGTGKTVLAATLARTSKLPYMLVNCPDLFQTDEGASESQLCSLFHTLQSGSRASFLILDEIDMLAERSAVRKGVEAKVFTTLLKQIDDLNRNPSANKVFIIALTNRPHVIDKSLTRSGRLDKAFVLNLGSASQRLEVLDIISRHIPFATDNRRDILERIARITHGFVPTDLQALCTEAALILVSKVANSERDAKLDLTSFMHALKSVRPSGMGEFQTKIPDVHFSDLYGLESAIMDLKVSVVEPFQQPGKYFDLGIAPPRGVLIHGPPGVGKTMLCCALAQELGINFMLVEGSQIRSKIVGESEQNIARMFAQAKANAPCILFIDQIDVLAPARGTTFSSENSGDRIVTSLLTEMDGFFTGRAGSVVDVLVLAATNRPEVIDSAIMRPGRLDQIIHVPVPDEAVRLKILAGFLSKMPIKLDQEQFKTLAKDTDGFSGADLENLCREAALICLRENIHNGQVEWTHLQAAKRLIPPSLLHHKPAGVTFKR